jgi:hypothetical protein
VALQKWEQNPTECFHVCVSEIARRLGLHAPAASKGGPPDGGGLVGELDQLGRSVVRVRHTFDVSRRRL